MTPQEAAELISVIAESLEAAPDQFTLNVQATAIGLKSTSVAGGGPGLVSTAIGGDPGSVAIGTHAQASTGDVNVEHAKGVATDEINEVISTLRALSAAVDKEDGKKSKTLMGKLKGLASATPVILETAKKALELAKLAF